MSRVVFFVVVEKSKKKMNNFRLVFVSRTVATGPRGSSKEDGAADSPADCKPLQSTSNGDYTGTLFTHEEIS